MTATSDVDIAARIQSLTEVSAPYSCPELPMWLGSPQTPLWRASEAELNAWQCPEPYWAFAWPGGQALARVVLDQPELVRGLDVLDFGGGGGVLSLAALRSGARRVVLSELDPWARIAAQLNLGLSPALPKQDMQVRLEDLIGRDVDEQVILVGDVLYEEALALRVLPWLRRQARRGVRVLIGEPGRGHASLVNAREIARVLAPTDTGLDGSILKELGVVELPC
ncbi:MAG: methyltransferase [Polyangiaceae bacterium]|nr:methyltransferase [Myxococcales bacterium]MCB9585514.1 methyltransferase [Polyangiaceae bacterium]MCB9606470.1 methyltransferase [Polyangiaceae bacterium]